MPKNFSQNEIEARKLSFAKVSQPRRAGPQDTPFLLAHYLRLNELDRYTRFFSAMSDDGIERYADASDWSRMVAVCVYSGEDLVGVAELGWEECGKPAKAELGVSVEAGFRRRGLASWLVHELFRWGAAIGVQDVHASWVGGNDAVGRIMQEYDAKIWLSCNHWRGQVSLASRPEVVAHEKLHYNKVAASNSY